MKKIIYLTSALILCVGCGKNKPTADTADEVIEKVKPKKIQAKKLEGPYASMEDYCEKKGLSECNDSEATMQKSGAVPSAEQLSSLGVVGSTGEGFRHVLLIGEPGQLFELDTVDTWADEAERGSRYWMVQQLSTDFAPEGFFNVKYTVGTQTPTETPSNSQYDYRVVMHTCKVVEGGLACARFVTEVGQTTDEDTSADASGIAMHTFTAVKGTPATVELTKLWDEDPEGVDLSVLTEPGVYTIVLP